MFKLKIPKTGGIKQFLLKLPLWLASHAFLTFLMLFLISLAFASYAFFKYSFSVKKVSPQTSEKQIRFDRETYQAVIDIWQERENDFEEPSSGDQINPFR